MSDPLAAVELLKLVLAQRPTGDIPTKEQVFELYWECLEAIDGRPPVPAQPSHSGPLQTRAHTNRDRRTTR